MPHPSEHPKRNWWQTLPGVLTALAAVLSAITGLVVAINQSRGSETPHDATPPSAAVSSSSGRAEPPARTQPSPSGAAPTTLPTGRELRLSGGRVVLRIVAATVDPFNQTTRVLRLGIRFTNNGETFDRDYYWTFRLLVDGVPRAPEDRGYEQIEAHSAKELEYAFKVPVSPAHVVLRVSKDKGEEADVPFDLP